MSEKVAKVQLSKALKNRKKLVLVNAPKTKNGTISNEKAVRASQINKKIKQSVLNRLLREGFPEVGERGEPLATLPSDLKPERFAEELQKIMRQKTTKPKRLADRIKEQKKEKKLDIAERTLKEAQETTKLLLSEAQKAQLKEERGDLKDKITKLRTKIPTMPAGFETTMATTKLVASVKRVGEIEEELKGQKSGTRKTKTKELPKEAQEVEKQISVIQRELRGKLAGSKVRNLRREKQLRDLLEEEEEDERFHLLTEAGTPSPEFIAEMEKFRETRGKEIAGKVLREGMRRRAITKAEKKLKAQQEIEARAVGQQLPEEEETEAVVLTILRNKGLSAQFNRVLAGDKKLMEELTASTDEELDKFVADIKDIKKKTKTNIGVLEKINEKMFGKGIMAGKGIGNPSKAHISPLLKTAIQEHNTRNFSAIVPLSMIKTAMNNGATQGEVAKMLKEITNSRSRSRNMKQVVKVLPYNVRANWLINGSNS